MSYQINTTWAKVDAECYPLSIHLNQTTLETFIGDNTWKGVGVNVGKIDPLPENCDYITESIVIPPTPIPLTRYLYASISVAATSSLTTIFLGANSGVGSPATEPNVDYIPDIKLLNANQEGLLTLKIPVQISDVSTTYVDFFLKADKNFDVKSAIFILGEKESGEL